MGTGVKVGNDNFLDASGVVISASSGPSSIPVTNILDPIRGNVWRSSGNYVVIAAANDKLDFDEGAGELTGTLTAGTYDATSLAAEIKTQLDAAGADVYTVTHDATSGKFTLASDGSTFTLRWSTGTNAATSIGTSIGFDVNSNDTGLLSYTADFAAWHTEEWIKFDLGSSKSVSMVMVVDHNIQTTGVLRIEMNDTDVWTAPSYSENMLLVSGCSGVLVDSVSGHSLPETRRWIRVLMIDPKNPDTFVKVGIVYVGVYVELEHDWNKGMSLTPVDPSVVTRSYDRQKSVDIRTNYDVIGWKSPSMSDYTALRALIDGIGTHIDVPLLLDSNDKTVAQGVCRLAYWGAFTAYGLTNPYKDIFDTDFNFEEST